MLAVNLVGPVPPDQGDRRADGPARQRADRQRHAPTRRSSAYPRWGAYGASKAALEHLGRVWAAELEGTGVRVDQRRPRRDGHAHARRRDPRRRSARRSPIRPRVAARIVGADRPRRASSAERRRLEAPRRVEASHEPARPGRASAARRAPAPHRSARRDARATRTSPTCPRCSRAGDLLVVNDGATLPASLRGHRRRPAGRGAPRSPRARDGRFRAVLFGAGDWRDAHRGSPAPAALARGRLTALRRGLSAVIARVSPASPRLVELPSTRAATRSGRRSTARAARSSTRISPRRSPLWHVQTGYADRGPGAPRCPRPGGRSPGSSCSRCPARACGGLAHPRGRALVDRRSRPRRRAAAPRALRDPGGDRARRGRDARPRRPRRRRRHDRGPRARGRRACTEGGLRARRPARPISSSPPAFRPRIVDGILSGAHAAHESHFSLLAAFAGPALLAAAAAHAERAGFLTHELGDSMLVLPGALAAAQPRPSATETAR